ncbi:MAG TPA: site-2 protease family protein [Candidatus Binatia bacterium]|nr:site-2 protease family protein [Candidatus Binatia bacterium]
MGASLRVLSVGGIDVFVHVSWLVIFLLITWSLGTSYFPAAVPDATDAQHFILGAVAAVLLLVSVLLHELAHSFVAKARGLGVHSITLFIFGGVSNLAGEAKRPGTEFQIAIVGPLTSFAIAVVAFLVAESVDVAPVAAVAGYLAAINVLLGVFNLVPGFPLDGGRVLRSIVWSATGSLQRATDIAAGAGTLVAWGLMLLGFWRLLNGDVFGGLWMAAIGWFLQNAAETSQRQTRVESQLRNLRVRDVANRSATPADAATSVAELIERYILPGGQRAVPIVSGDRLLGIVTLSDVARVPVEDRGRTTAAEIMSGPDSLVTVTPETPLRDAVERLAQGDFEQLPVVDGGRLLGLLTRADVVGLLQIRAALGIGEEEGRRTRARA